MVIKKLAKFLLFLGITGFRRYVSALDKWILLETIGMASVHVFMKDVVRKGCIALLHLEQPKLQSFGHSECNRVTGFFKQQIFKPVS